MTKRTSRVWNFTLLLLDNNPMYGLDCIHMQYIYPSGQEIILPNTYAYICVSSYLSKYLGSDENVC